MAKKSAARMQTYKGEPKQEIRPVDESFEVAKKELPPIEEVFEDAKNMFVLTVETQIKTAKRVDNLMNIRDFCKRFWGDEANIYDDLAYYKSMQKLSITVYEGIRDIAKTFELVDFRAIEVKDYFAELIPDVDSISSKQELLEAALIFMSVQPYGSKLIQMHQLIQDECAKRDILSEEEE